MGITARLLGAVCVAGLMALAPAGHAQDEHETTTTRHELRFAKGRTSATVKGTIAYDQRHEWHFKARPGQRATVRLETEDPDAYFDMYVEAGFEAVAVTPEGEKVKGEWSGVLAKGGNDYDVHVMTDGSGGPYTLTVEIR